MNWEILLGTTPWVILGGYLLLGVRAPRPLPRLGDPSPAADRLPSVTIIVPARNEARNIAPCLQTLTAQEYPDFDIVVVDDGSDDDTGNLARGISRGTAREIRVISGESLPEGWFGKPWACHQGAQGVKTDLLLFTDADTRHAPDLLARALTGMREDGVRALTLNGHQEAKTPGELLIQPQVFALIGLRYPRLDRRLSPDQAGHAIANGQYILVERTAYEDVGGHEAVRSEVAEDLRLAQVLTAAGYPFSFRNALDAFSTRMYHSLREAIAGWTKNVAVGGAQAGGKLGAIAPLGMMVYLPFFWILPPTLFLRIGSVAALTGELSSFGGPPSTTSALFAGSGVATLLSLLTWVGLYRRFRLPVRYALLYPIGAALVTWIAFRSWMRGTRRIEWRGRRYSAGAQGS